MNKSSFTILIACLSLMAILLSSCGTVTITDFEAATAQFQTAVAGTVTAQVPTDTPTPKFTQTYIPTETIVPTITDTPSNTPIPPTTVMDTYCDNSAFVEDVTYPDHSILAPGQVFEKTWKLKNIGKCTWKPGYTITFAKGDMMQGYTRSINQTVDPQGTVDITVRLYAPNTPGDYTGAWRLTNGKGEKFGALVWVMITVAGPGTTVPSPEASTPAVTPTATP